MTPDQDYKIMNLVKEVGCDWEYIGEALGGMSGIKIRNRYYSRIYKKLKLN